MTTALSIRGLALSRGDRRVLDGLDLDVEAGEVVAIMGASGAGKSTILRCIAALETFSGGTIAVGDARLVAGAVPPQSALVKLRQQVAMVFQNHALFDHLSAVENVMLAPVHVQRWTPSRARTAALALFEQLGISARASAFPRELSGGEAQRVAIARALIGNPSLLLMDEPTAALDPARRGILAATLRGLAREGRAILVVTHDAEFAEAVADRTMELVNGTL